MSRNKYILPILLCSLFTTCKVADVPEHYKFNGYEVKANIYGSWIIITHKPEDQSVQQTVAGELLALGEDSVYLLISNGKACIINRSSVIWAALCTHRKKTGTYLLLTVLFSAPAYIGAIVHPGFAYEFLELGYPVTITGMYHVIKEGATRSNFLIYPTKNSLGQFQRFARYPAGLPENIDFTTLHLKQMTFTKHNTMPAGKVN